MIYFIIPFAIVTAVILIFSDFDDNDDDQDGEGISTQIGG